MANLKWRRLSAVITIILSIQLLLGVLVSRLTVKLTSDPTSLASINRNDTHEIIAQNPDNIDSHFVTVTRNYHIYSAYWDTRYKFDFVRLFGVIRYFQNMTTEENKYLWTGEIKPSSLNLDCYLWYETLNFPLKGNLTAKIYEEGKLVFVGTYFRCQPLDQQPNTPYAVSLTPKEVIGYPHKLIKVQESSRPGKKFQTNVCVRPLFGPFNDKLSLIQFVMYYKSVLKVDQFQFYELSVTKLILTTILELQQLGVNIVVHSWNIPTGDTSELWDFGSLTALNDCIYRSKSEFVIIVDLDEFIVPVKEEFSSVPQLYKDALLSKRATLGDALIVLNRFFCQEFDFKNDNKFPIFKFTLGEARLWPPKERSKLIIYTTTVSIVGHHQVLEFTQGIPYSNVASPQTFATLHHYRSCQDIHLGVHGQGSSVLKYKPKQILTLIKRSHNINSSLIWRHYVQEGFI